MGGGTNCKDREQTKRFKRQRGVVCLERAEGVVLVLQSHHGCVCEMRCCVCQLVEAAECLTAAAQLNEGAREEALTLLRQLHVSPSVCVCVCVCVCACACVWV